MAKSTTTKKNTTKKSTKKASTSKRGRPTKKQQADVNRLWSILMFAIGAILTVMSFVPGENFWSYLRENFLFGVFGFSSYIIGPVILYYGALTLNNKPVRLKMIWGTLFILLVSSLVHVFLVKDIAADSLTDMIIQLHTLAKNNPISGGVIAILATTLQGLFGDFAAKAVITVLTIAFFMFLTDTTPGDIVKRMSIKAAAEKERLAKEMEERRRANAEKRKLQEEKLRQQARENRANKARRNRRKIDIALEDKPATKVITAEDVKKAMSQEKKEVNYFDDDSLDVKGRVAYTFDKVKEEKAKDDLDKILRQVDKSKSRGENNRESADNRSTELTNKALDNIRRVRNGTPAVETTTATAPSSRTADRKQSIIDDINSQMGDFETEKVMTDEQRLARERKKNSLTAEEKVAIVPLSEDKNVHMEKAYVYKHPPIDLYQKESATDRSDYENELRSNAQKLVSTLDSFGVRTKIVDISRGPAVTRYELQPEVGVKISKITNLADDIALNLASSGVRIEAPIPGKAAVGIEVPNKKNSSVSIRRIFESKQFRDSKSPLTIALGVDIEGNVVTTDLTRMPHLLIAGSTGSGKSVCVNATIISFIFKSSPEDVKMILIDPKVVELAEYNGIPHLLMPVVTEPKKAAGALGSAVAEMEKRYQLFAENSVRNIESYNALVKSKPELGLEKMPYIAIIIDELADLMMVAGKEVEDYICRLAQKARASGMHLIVATQRPSVDVITGLIKANIPSRIAFAVSSQIDSRTIIDGAGAEKLLGMGDMLFLPVGASKPKRVQGTYVRDEEIEKTIDFVKKDFEVEYDQEMIDSMEKLAVSGGKGTAGASEETGDDSDRDMMLDKAIETVVEAGQASTSLLQRKLKLGYARAARIMDEMEEMGIIGPYQGSKPREVLVTRAQWQEMMLSQGE